MYCDVLIDVTRITSRAMGLCDGLMQWPSSLTGNPSAWGSMATVQARFAFGCAHLALSPSGSFPICYFIEPASVSPSLRPEETFVPDAGGAAAGADPREVWKIYMVTESETTGSITCTSQRSGVDLQTKFVISQHSAKELLEWGASCRVCAILLRLGTEAKAKAASGPGRHPRSVAMSSPFSTDWRRHA